MTRSVTEIVVPGSTSNLGPGFDALSVAVDVYLRVRVLEVLPDRRGAMELAFDGAAPDGENRIETAFRRAQAKVGAPASGVRAQVASGIPMTAGLGSSAAACLAGIRLYEMAA